MNIRSAIAGLLVLLVLTLFLPGCAKRVPALSQLTNSGFEQPLDSGWVQTVVNDSNPLDSGTIERSDTLGQPGSGFAVRVYKFHREHAVLSQTVEMETLGQVVSFDARFRIGANVPCTPVAAVGFDYLDDSSNPLARTLIYLPSSYCTWINADTLHLIRVTDTTGQWTRYSLNIETELDSFLPLVAQERIKRLRVELSAYVDYSG
jgi:hypothetical protein